MKQRSQHTHAFTLIELLTVVAVLALLIAIVVPSLAAAREQAKAVVCASQMRELFRALHMYTEDNRGWLPYMGSYYRVRKFGHPPTEREWTTAIAPLIDQVWEMHRCPTDPDPVAADVVDGVLEPARSTPADAVPGADRERALLSYRGEERRRARLVAPARPHDAILLIEGLTHVSFTRPMDHFHTLVRPGAGADAVHPSFGRHHEQSHFLFFSGSIERISRRALGPLQMRHLNADLPSVYAAPR